MSVKKRIANRHGQENMSNSSLSGPKALGAFLRTQREMLTPERVGLPAAGRRRTSGLRREELAQLSRISTTWYTWIEQGREVSVSPAALSRLAQALQLAPAERDYLFNLANVKDPDKHPEALPLGAQVTAALRYMDCPAYLLDGGWNVLDWNTQAQALFRGWLGEDPQPNLLRFMFVNPLAKQIVVDWPERARRVVAEFRAESSHYSHEMMRELVMQLCRDSREFERWWTQQAVMAREGGERRFHHATTCQEITYQQQTFHPALHQEFKLVMLIPAETGDRPTPR